MPPASSVNEPPGGPVLLFDGECGLCQRIVRWLLRLDRGGVLRFAPLQGPAAQGFLRQHGLPADDFDSLVFVPDWSCRAEKNYLLRTDGVVAALRAAGVPRRAAWLALWPRALRDAGYRLVARLRYRIFGEWKPDPLSQPEWTARFLD
jgi:predicted DCC family thiol-disulfide oxidoreductase YuxK